MVSLLQEADEEPMKVEEVMPTTAEQAGEEHVAKEAGVTAHDEAVEEMPQEMEEERLQEVKEEMPPQAEEEMPQQEAEGEVPQQVEEEMPQEMQQAAAAQAGPQGCTPKRGGGRLDRPAVVNKPGDKRFAKEYLVPLAREVRDGWGWRFKDMVKDFHEQALSEPVPPSNCAVALCVTTYMRTFQIKQMLPINLCFTWKHRANIFWIIADFNMTNDVQDFMLDGLVQEAVLSGHVKYFRALEKFSWHASVAKNTSKMAARLLTREGFPEENIYVVCLDNDNIVTSLFLDDIQRCAEFQCAQVRDHEIQGNMDKEVGGSWASGEPGTTGRIGCPLKVFMAMKGYDEDFLPMGGQDVCLLKRLGIIGKVRVTHEAWTGFSVPNQEAKMGELMETMKALKQYSPSHTHHHRCCHHHHPPHVARV